MCRGKTVASLQCQLRRIGALRMWEERLQQSDSVFARLVFVSQLRDATGRYADPFLLRVFPARICHKVLGEAHRHVFREWLALSARLKLRDVQRYCAAICQRDGPGEVAWTSLCCELVPSGISINELNLFCGDAKRFAQIIRRQQLLAARSSDHMPGPLSLLTDQ